MHGKFFLEILNIFLKKSELANKTRKLMDYLELTVFFHTTGSFGHIGEVLF